MKMMKFLMAMNLMSLIFLSSANDFSNFADSEIWSFNRKVEVKNNELTLNLQTIGVLKKALPKTSTLIVETDLVVNSIQGEDTLYKTCGIRIANGKDFWGFYLIERPKGYKISHYLELRLFQNDKWQYDEGKTKNIVRDNSELCWDFKEKYRLHLVLEKNKISGYLLDASDKKMISKIEYTFNDSSLLNTGVPAIFNQRFDCTFSNFDVINQSGE